MITLCTVVGHPDTDGPFEGIHRLMIESALRLSTSISRVVVSVPSEYDESVIDNSMRVPVIYRHFAHPPELNRMSINHAIGLHKAMDLAQTEYIMICDPDVFFCMPAFDEFYLKTYHDNGLNIIGIRHYQDWHAIGGFPTIINCLVRKKDLPGPEMFAGKIHYFRRCWEKGCDETGQYPQAPDEYYLICGCVPEYFRLYPFPSGYYDTGSKLYAWNHLKGGRWLSFGPGKGYATSDCHLSNFDNPKISKQGQILYHQARMRNKEVADLFRAEYQKCLGLTLV